MRQQTEFPLLLPPSVSHTHTVTQDKGSRATASAEGGRQASVLSPEEEFASSTRPCQALLCHLCKRGASPGHSASPADGCLSTRCPKASSPQDGWVGGEACCPSAQLQPSCQLPCQEEGAVPGAALTPAASAAALPPSLHKIWRPTWCPPRVGSGEPTLHAGAPWPTRSRPSSVAHSRPGSGAGHGHSCRPTAQQHRRLYL